MVDVQPSTAPYKQPDESDDILLPALSIVRRTLKSPADSVVSPPKTRRRSTFCSTCRALAHFWKPWWYNRARPSWCIVSLAFVFLHQRLKLEQAFDFDKHNDRKYNAIQDFESSCKSIKPWCGKTTREVCRRFCTVTFQPTRPCLPAVHGLPRAATLVRNTSKSAGNEYRQYHNNQPTTATWFGWIASTWFGIEEY